VDIGERLSFDTETVEQIAEKTKLLEGSYAEVLDATKHQDDKIGRLLTTVAFLTAASLAFAGLSQGQWITQRFSVPPHELKLGLITLAVFLLGVVFTVVLLLTSLATPLRLPGFAEGSPGSRMRWVRDVPASQLYFYEIARVSVDEWRHKWRANAERLAVERVESLVRETHNLGVRTSFKYDRFNEAVAVLSVALLSFATSAALVAFAAGAGAGTGSQMVVGLGPWHRLVLAMIVAVYCGSQLVARVRSTRPSVENSFPADEASQIRRRIVGDALFAVLVPLTVGAIVLVRAPNWLGVAVVGTLVAGCYTAYWLSSTPNRDAKSGRRLRRRAVGLVIALGYGAAAVWHVARDHYAGQLAVAAAGVLLLLVPTALSSVLAMAARRREYRKRMQTFDQRVLASEEAAGDAGAAQQVADVAGVADGTGEHDAELADPGSLDEPLELR
jgi:hypothetical protein